jgi:predicted nucleic acid-binding protein
VGLIDALGRGPVGIDTAPFIYFIEEHPSFVRVLDELFGWIDAGKLAAVTSGITLLEVLVLPLRASNRPLAERYRELLTRSRGLELVLVDEAVLVAAAQLRASYPRLRTPDALQVGTALLKGCTAFVTNDRELPAVPGLSIVQLSDLLGMRSS